MKEFLNKPENIKKIEFWAVTTIFVFAVFFLITIPVRNDFAWAPNKSHFNRVNMSYNLHVNYIFPQLIRYIFLYLAFLGLNFYVVPKFIRREALALNIALIFLIILVLGVVFGTTDTYLKTYFFASYENEQAAYNRLFQDNFIYAFWLVLMFGFYCIIKYTGLYLLSHSEAIQSKYSFITPGVITTFLLWMITVFLLMLGDAEGVLIIGWIIFSLSGILLFLYSFNSVIPKALGKKKPFRFFLLRLALILILSILPVSLLVMLITNNEEAAFTIGFFNAIFHLFITAPLTWVVFKRQMKGNEEIYYLKRELGQTHASFDFLRSQINPHFLFNALNTIYGTAIQEKAERTSEGIEKLGDMMRFMLQENMQEKIPLSREIEYLNNYIGLQTLRTDGNPDVNIKAHIEEPVEDFQISPMLLIPFVENAFKHGISFREPSHINITLEIKDNTLYFDVYNSKHLKQGSDPEKYKSGIGLRNVKQRLLLLYQDSHELVIRETGKEYFIHLTIQLS